MSNRRSPLGRGLGALITPSADDAAARRGASAETAVAAAGNDGPRELPIDSIQPNPDQPRRVFDQDQLDRLAKSIQRYGVLQPVVVREARGGYELLVGERRWRASQVAGRKTIPAVVAEIDADSRLAVALVENVQRHDLNPLELANAFHALSEAGATQEEIGESVGLDRSTVANHIRLLELPLDVQTDVEAGRLSMGHARALLAAKSPERVRHLRTRIVEGGLSVREAEELARNASGRGGKPAARRKTEASGEGGADRGAAQTPAELRPLAEALRQHLQTQVQIRGGAERGRLEIEYFSSEDLERLCDTILDGR